MSSYSFKVALKPGYTGIPGNVCGFRFIAEFGILKLGIGETYTFATGDRELGMMVLSGKCAIDIDGKRLPVGKREDVFHGLPQAVYVPPGYSFKVSGGPVEAAICQTKAPQGGNYRVIADSDITVNQVGKANWSREVRLAIPPRGFSRNLIMGETINPPGNWSGTPPQKHEVESLPQESVHEELYYFKTDKPQGWGMMRLYSPSRGVNDLIYLEDNTVTLIPWGYHQVVAAPGYTLYYLFFLAGQGNDLRGNDDPQQNWIMK